jgi:hypothetical protein
MGKKKKDQKGEAPKAPGSTEEDIWCYYCDYEAGNLEKLITHQRNRHFTCQWCESGGSAGKTGRCETIFGLQAHMQKTHKKPLTEVPNSIKGRKDPSLNIVGMSGIPKELWEERRIRTGVAVPVQTFGSMEAMNGVRYLPTHLDGVRVLVDEGENQFRADNSILHATTKGVGYRKSKDLHNKDAGRALPWGEMIVGIDEEDGWVRCELLLQDQSFMQDSLTKEQILVLTAQQMEHQEQMEQETKKVDEKEGVAAFDITALQARIAAAAAAPPAPPEPLSVAPGAVPMFPQAEGEVLDPNALWMIVGDVGLATSGWRRQPSIANPGTFCFYHAATGRTETAHDLAATSPFSAEPPSSMGAPLFPAAGGQGGTVATPANATASAWTPTLGTAEGLNGITAGGMPALPPGWKRRESRSKPGQFFFCCPASGKTAKTIEEAWTKEGGVPPVAAEAPNGTLQMPQAMQAPAPMVPVVPEAQEPVKITIHPQGPAQPAPQVDKAAVLGAVQGMLNVSIPTGPSVPAAFGPEAAARRARQKAKEPASLEAAVLWNPEADEGQAQQASAGEVWLPRAGEAAEAVARPAPPPSPSPPRNRPVPRPRTKSRSPRREARRRSFSRPRQGRNPHSTHWSDEEDPRQWRDRGRHFDSPQPSRSLFLEDEMRRQKKLAKGKKKDKDKKRSESREGGGRRRAEKKKRDESVD